jgi:hypothetical protein
LITFSALATHDLLDQLTLKHRLRALAPGLTPRAVGEKFAPMQMVDVHLLTTDSGYLVLPRYTQPDKDQKGSAK